MPDAPLSDAPLPDALTVRTVAAGRSLFHLLEVGRGDGTPVLLLHGVPETSSCWQDIAPALAVGRRVLAPDLPGLGRTPCPAPYDIRSVVADLVALIDQEAGRPVDVVGHDWGGILAFALAGLRPDLVRRLVVTNAPYRDASLLRAAHVGLFCLPLLPEGLLCASGSRWVRWAIKGAWGSGPALDAARLAEYEAAYTTPSVRRAMLGYYRALARPRRGAARPLSTLGGLPQVEIDDVVLVWGAQDPVLPIAVAEAAAKRLGADTRLVTIPAAGHFLPEEAPEALLEVLADALR